MGQGFDNDDDDFRGTIFLVLGDTVTQFSVALKFTYGKRKKCIQNFSVFVRIYTAILEKKIWVFDLNLREPY